MGWDLNFVQLMHFNEKRARDVQPYKTAKHLQTRCRTLQFMAPPPPRPGAEMPGRLPSCVPGLPRAGCSQNNAFLLAERFPANAVDSCFRRNITNSERKTFRAMPKGPEEK